MRFPNTSEIAFCFTETTGTDPMHPENNFENNCEKVWWIQKIVVPLHREKLILLTLLEQYKQLGISKQIDYQKFYLYSIITHSTAIEGPTVTEIEAQRHWRCGYHCNIRVELLGALRTRYNPSMGEKPQGQTLWFDNPFDPHLEMSRNVNGRKIWRSLTYVNNCKAHKSTENQAIQRVRKKLYVNRIIYMVT